MRAITFIIETAFNIVLSLFLVRAMLQFVRANFRNPITQFITRFTNPVIMPLRKILPPLGKVDTASVTSCILIALGMSAILILLKQHSLVSISQNPAGFLLFSLKQLLQVLLQLYWFLILFSIIISWMQPQQHSPLTSLLSELTEPVLAPVRRLIPPIGGLDLSPIPVLIILSALQYQFAV